MKDKKSLNKILILIFFFIAGFTISYLIFNAEAYPMSLKVIGDVEKVIDVSEENFKMEKFKYKEENMKGFKLKDIVDISMPFSEDYNIYFIGLDGNCSRINNSIEGSYIRYSNEKGWEAINLNHPINSNIKMLKEIVIVINDEDLDKGLNVISTDENIKSITPGNLYITGLNSHFCTEGFSTTKGKYDSEVLKEKKIFSIDDIYPGEFQQALTMGETGGYAYIDEKGCFVFTGNSFDYLDPDGSISVEKVKGIFIDPPRGSIMDAYYDSVHYLESGEKVLILYLDGFGYHQYIDALEKGYAPYLKSIGKGERALSVYKPVTNAGFAAMITGKSPIENGVMSRNEKDLKVPSIFDEIEKLNKKGTLIEGDIKILNTEIEPILNIDKNGNGTDDEIFECAKKYIKKDDDFVLVHFHTIDDSGHKYGDLSKETMETIKVVDRYLDELASSWDGVVIITTDHGMHSILEAGNHGEFRYEDLVVPYILYKGENEQ